MRAAAGARFGGGLQVVQPRFEALPQGLGRGGHVRFDLVAGPGLLGVDVDTALDLAEGPQVDWTPSSMRRPSPIAGPFHRMQSWFRRCRTVEVISSVVAGVWGVAGAGVVQRNREPFRSRPGSRRSIVVTGGCQDGQPSTSVWSFQTVRSGALITMSDL